MCEIIISLIITWLSVIIVNNNSIDMDRSKTTSFTFKMKKNEGEYDKIAQIAPCMWLANVCKMIVPYRLIFSLISAKLKVI